MILNIYLYTVKWFQVTLFNMNITINQVPNMKNLYTEVWFKITTNNKPSKRLNSLIWPTDGTLIGTIDLGQSGPESNGNEGYSTFPKHQDRSPTIRCSSMLYTEDKIVPSILLSNTNNSIQHYSFVCIEFKWF